MNANKAIGSKVKELRMDRNLTLKQLSEASGLSIGFLSQFERGLSSIALDSLEKLAEILEVSLFDLLEKRPSVSMDDPVCHHVDLLPSEISPEIYQYMLGPVSADFVLLPRIYLLLPFGETATVSEPYVHEGEEFIYVLEGVITMYLEDSQYVLYPGDSIHILSKQPHNWMNRTNKIARILTVNTPNPLHHPEAEEKMNQEEGRRSGSSVS